MISDTDSYNDKEDRFNDTDIIENMTISLLVELLDRGFSHQYLNYRLLIFTASDHFYRGNIQHKIDTLFRDFLKEQQKYTVIFRLHDSYNFPKNLSLQNVVFVSEIPEKILSDITFHIKAMRQQIRAFFEKTEKLNTERMIINMVSILGLSDKNIIRLMEYVSINAEDLFDNIVIDVFTGFIDQVKSISRKLMNTYYDNPSTHNESLSSILEKPSPKWISFISSFDLDFALLSNREIFGIIESISNKKSISLLRAYLYRVHRIYNCEKDLNKLQDILELLKGKKKKFNLH